MKKQRILIGTLALVLLLALAVGLSQAQGPEPEGEVQPEGEVSSAATVNSRISYQGMLKEDGTPVTGSRDMIFRLYSDSPCTTQVGSDIVKNGVTVTDGLFSVELDVTHSHFNGQGLWLEVEVGGIAIGCQEILPVPYALSLRPGARINDADSVILLNRLRFEFPTLAEHKYGLEAEVDGSYDFAYGIYGTANNQRMGTPAYGLYGSATGNTAYGVYGQSETDSADARGVYGTAPYTGVEGHATSTSGATSGVYGQTDSSSDYAKGVRGYASASSGETYGVHGQTDSSTSGAAGVYGYASAISGPTNGVQGEAVSASGRGVYGAAPKYGLLGDATASDGESYGVLGRSYSPSGAGVYGYATATDGATSGVYGKTDSSSDNAAGVYGKASANGGETYGVRGESDSSTGGSSGVFGKATAASGQTYGVSGRSDSPDGAGVYGESGSLSGIGVSGKNTSTYPGSDGIGVRGSSRNGIGVYGVGGNGVGVKAEAAGFAAVEARNSADGFGLYAESQSGTALQAITDGGDAAVDARNTTDSGVYGESQSGAGVYAVSSSGRGVYAESAGPGSDGTAVYARATGADGIALWGTSSSTDSTLVLRNDGTGDLIRGFSHGDWKLRFQVKNDGWTAVRVLQITGGGDLSERFDVTAAGGEVTPGLVVCIDANHPGKLLVCTNAYDRTVAGVVSGAGGIEPGMVMGQEGSPADGAYPVALTGRVYVWADASYGPIRPGDLLTTSDTAGLVMKVTDYERAQGAIIGKAMSSLDEGQGLILVLVGLQ